MVKNVPCSDANIFPEYVLPNLSTVSNLVPNIIILICACMPLYNYHTMFEICFLISLEYFALMHIIFVAGNS